MRIKKIYSASQTKLKPNLRKAPETVNTFYPQFVQERRLKRIRKINNPLFQVLHLTSYSSITNNQENLFFWHCFFGMFGNTFGCQHIYAYVLKNTFNSAFMFAFSRKGKLRLCTKPSRKTSTYRIWIRSYALKRRSHRPEQGKQTLLTKSLCKWA